MRDDRAGDAREPVLGHPGRGVRFSTVMAAIDVPRSPDLPGTPWSAGEIAAVPPLLAKHAAGGSLAVAAETARRLAAFAAEGPA